MLPVIRPAIADPPLATYQQVMFELNLDQVYDMLELLDLREHANRKAQEAAEREAAIKRRR